MRILHGDAKVFDVHIFVAFERVGQVVRDVENIANVVAKQRACIGRVLLVAQVQVVGYLGRVAFQNPRRDRRCCQFERGHAARRAAAADSKWTQAERWRSLLDVTDTTLSGKPTQLWVLLKELPVATCNEYQHDKVWVKKRRVLFRMKKKTVNWSMNLVDSDIKPLTASLRLHYPSFLLLLSVLVFLLVFSFFFMRRFFLSLFLASLKPLRRTRFPKTCCFKYMLCTSASTISAVADQTKLAVSLSYLQASIRGDSG